MKKIRILIADDSELILEALDIVFQRQSGIEVVALAQDGEEAILQYRAHLPDVLLTDFQMPKKTGVEVIQTLSAEFPLARFILLTACDKEDLPRTCHALDAVILSKSASAVHIVATVRSIAARD